MISEVDDGVYRGPRPSIPDDWDVLRELGVRTVLNLEEGFFEWFHQRVNEEQKNVELRSWAYIHYPFSDFFPPTRNEVENCLHWIDNARGANSSIYFHCLHGVDRTGFLAAAYRVRVQGWEVERAVEEWFQFGFNRFFYFWWPAAFRKMMKNWE